MAMGVKTKKIDTDLLVVGSGVAGLRAAVEARRVGVDVIVVSKGPIGLANCTAIAGGGICAALGHADRRDNPNVHFEDTIKGGRYLSDPRLVKVFTEEAPKRVLELEKFGVPFKKHEDKFIQLQQPGHTYPRDCKIYGPKRSETWVPPFLGGKLLTGALESAAVKMGVKTMENITIFDVIRNDNQIIGACGIDTKSGEILIFQIKSIILATGGAGQVYAKTIVPPDICGDGYAIALNQGVELLDMEFVQFYAPVIDEHGLPRWNLPYWLFLEVGAVILDKNGGIIAHKGVTAIDDLTRDKMAQICALQDEVYFDFTKIDQTTWKTFDFKSMKDAISKYGFDVAKTPIRVSPMSYFFMGGIRINEKCETGLEGLYAAGEVVGGIHGANRLGSNALPEALVFGAIAGWHAANYAGSISRSGISDGQVNKKCEKLFLILNNKPNELGNPKQTRNLLQDIMWRYASVIRDKKSLENGLKMLMNLRKSRMPMSYAGNFKELKLALENGFMLDTAEMICKAALFRKESRGAHYRVDYPKEDKKLCRNIIIKQKEEGKCLELKLLKLGI